jgi:hypothetical protein
VCSMNGDTNGATDSEHVMHGALPLSVIRDRISGVELFESVDDKLATRALQAMNPPLAAPLLDAHASGQRRQHPARA